MARRKGSGITSLKFNQDQGCFSCCLTTGLRIYNTDPLVEKAHYGVDEIGAVLLCEMVQRSNWLLVVRAKQPRTLALLDDTKRRIAVDVSFNSNICSLQARNDMVAVVTLNAVHVLSLPSLKRVAFLCRGGLSDCPYGVALSTGPTQVLVAPAHRPGSVQILDVSDAIVEGSSLSKTPVMLRCHTGHIAALALSFDATKLCTASQRGTLIRVWDLRTRKMIYNLRRGADQASIYCLSFSPDSRWICCVSDKGTAHLWRDDMHMGKAKIHTIYNNPTPAICAIKDNSLIVASSDGTFYKYSFSKEGSCHQEIFEYFLQVGDDDDFID